MNKNTKYRPSLIISPRKSWAALPVLIGALLLADQPALAGPDNPHVIPPNATYQGHTYPEWAGSFWAWALALPVGGHPFLACPKDFSAGQTGNVWYWAAPDGPATCRDVRLPPGTALFLTIRDIETSSLEQPPFFGATEGEQRANSKFFADHIVDVFCIIDGVPVKNVQAYRFSTPQIQFTAPTPWIFGNTGGTGTSVGDGYYMMLEPLSVGKHTIHYGGTFHFNAGELLPDPVDLPKDIIIELTVGEDGPARLNRNLKPLTGRP